MGPIGSTVADPTVVQMQKLEMKASGLPAQNLCHWLAQLGYWNPTTATVAQIMLLLLPELRQSQLTQSVEEDEHSKLLTIY